jgi:hypothetical protein
MNIRTLTVLALALTFSRPLAAQMMVRVEGRGVPLSGADVAVWDESGRLASAELWRTSNRSERARRREREAAVMSLLDNRSCRNFDSS